jgi:hypothetical protein
VNSSLLSRLRISIEFITDLLLSCYASLSRVDFFSTPVPFSLDLPFIQNRSWLHSLIREKSYAARISMEWLLNWLRKVATDVFSLQVWRMPFLWSFSCVLNIIYLVFFDEGPSHHSLKVLCATPMKMIRMSSFFYQFLQLMEHQWNEIDREKPTNRRKTCPSATLSTTNLTWTWPGTEPGASAMRGRRLTAWAMARPLFI